MLQPDEAVSYICTGSFVRPQTARMLYSDDSRVGVCARGTNLENLEYAAYLMGLLGIYSICRPMYRLIGNSFS